MGKVIQLHRKPIIILVLISTLLILWMCYKRSGSGIGNSLYKSRSKYSLHPNGAKFFLNRKPFRILSGAMHYFRIVPQYWQDRLLKLKAMGLNTVET